MEKSFLNQKYPELHGSKEVESAVHRAEVRGKKISDDVNERVNVYLERLEEISTHPEQPVRERKSAIFQYKLNELFIIKPEEVPESYFLSQKRIARERGHGDVEITEQVKQAMIDQIIADQKQSLGRWFKYFTSDGASYPTWLKYFAFRSIVGLSEYDKEKKEFRKRSRRTTALFPDLNQESLSYVLDALEQKEGKRALGDEKKLLELLETANFAKLYAYAIEECTPASKELRESVKGEWIKYDQGSNATELAQSLHGHGTGWCTAGVGVAKTQLSGGDFYVYYTEDEDGKYSIPRIAIRMEKGEVAEVRGIDSRQELEPKLINIAQQKFKDLPGGEKYEKTTKDMKRLTLIEAKATGNDNLSLSAEDIAFLYEIHGHIEGFGNGRDSRVLQLQPRLFDSAYIKFPEIMTPATVERLRKERDTPPYEYSPELSLRLNYQRYMHDLDIIRTIRIKLESGIELSKMELAFLYQIPMYSSERTVLVGASNPENENLPLAYDSRGKEIKVLSEKRDRKKDLANLYGCKIENIASNESELNDESVVYIGDITAEIISRMPAWPLKLKFVFGNINGNGSLIHHLGSLEQVYGDVSFKGSHLVDAGDLRKIHGKADFSNSWLTYLENLEFVEGDFSVENTKIESLPALKEIRGNIIDLRSTGLFKVQGVHFFSDQDILLLKDTEVVDCLDYPYTNFIYH